MIAVGLVCITAVIAIAGAAYLAHETYADNLNDLSVRDELDDRMDRYPCRDWPSVGLGEVFRRRDMKEFDSLIGRNN